MPFQCFVLFSGLGFGNCSTTLGHALSYVFSNEGFSHGHALAFTTTAAHKFNNSEFRYAACSTCTEKLGLKTYNKTNGFFTEYSKSTASEDMAEVYSHIIFFNKKEIDKISKIDPILKNKILYIKNKIKKIDNSFIF